MNEFNKTDLVTIKYALLGEIKNQVKNGPVMIRNGKQVGPDNEEVDFNDFIEGQHSNIIAASMALTKVIAQEALLDEMDKG